MSHDWRSYFTGQYLTAVELEGDVTVTILRAEGGQVEDPDNPGTDRTKLLLYLADGMKPWVISKTAGYCVAAMYGDDKRKWGNQMVTIYNDTEVKVGREKKGGIRVRGAPHLAKPITVEIRLARRRPKKVKLIRTEVKDGPRADLEEVLADLSLPVEALDQWLTGHDRPEVQATPPGKRQEIADWLVGHVEQVRAWLREQG